MNKEPTGCGRILPRLWMYVDRELPARELGQVSAHLRECDGCRRAYEQRAREAKVWRAALADGPFGDDFAERFRERFEKRTADIGFPAAARRALLEHLSSLALPASRRWWLVAALFVLVPGIVWVGFLLGGGETGRLGRVTVWRAAARLRDASGERLAGEGDVVAYGPGTAVEALAESRVRLTLGGREDRRGAGRRAAGEIELHGPAMLIVAEDSSLPRFRAELRRGELVANVLPRDRGELFEVVTPHAVARVVGTRFTLRVDEEADLTVLAVAEGKVQLVPARGGPAVLVRRGDPARAVGPGGAVSAASEVGRGSGPPEDLLDPPGEAAPAGELPEGRGPAAAAPESHGGAADAPQHERPPLERPATVPGLDEPYPPPR